MYLGFECRSLILLVVIFRISFSIVLHIIYQDWRYFTCWALTTIRPRLLN